MSYARVEPFWLNFRSYLYFWDEQVHTIVNRLLYELPDILDGSRMKTLAEIRLRKIVTEAIVVTIFVVKNIRNFAL